MGLGQSPSIPLALLNPGEFNMQPGNALGPGVGQNTSFPGALQAYVAGALAAVGYSSAATGLVASGSTSGNALPLTAQNNHFGTVATGTGGSLPVPGGPVPYPITVMNSGAQALSVYPPTALGTIGNSAPGAAFVQNTGTTVVYTYFTGTVFGHTP